MAVVVDTETCTGCGSCVSVCPAEAIKVEADTAIVDEDACIECGLCVDECPCDAISMPD